MLLKETFLLDVFDVDFKSCIFLCLANFSRSSLAASSASSLSLRMQLIQTNDMLEVY